MGPSAYKWFEVVIKTRIGLILCLFNGVFKDDGGFNAIMALTLFELEGAGKWGMDIGYFFIKTGGNAFLESCILRRK